MSSKTEEVQDLNELGQIHFFQILDSLSPRTPLTEKQAAWVLGKSVSQLQHWRSETKTNSELIGPPFIKGEASSRKTKATNTSVIYELGDLLKWRDARKVGSSEEADELVRLMRDRKLAKAAGHILSFADWVQVGQPDDEWLVVRTADGLRDVFSTFGDETVDPEDSFPIPLREYLLERLNSPSFAETAKLQVFGELADQLDASSHPGCRAAYSLGQALGLEAADAMVKAINGCAAAK